MKQLSGQDATFLYLESSGAHLNLTGLYVYQQAGASKQRIGYEQILQHVESRLHKVQMFRQKLVRVPLDLDHPYWADDPDFDLKSHIIRYDGPTLRSHRQLYDTVTSILVEPLDLSRPLWEMYVFEKLGRIRGLPPDCFAIITKYHHSAIDGASGSELIDGLHDSHPVKIVRSSASSWQSGSEPGMLKMLASAAINGVRVPWQLTKSLAGAVPGMVQSTLSRESTGDKGQVPKTRFNGAISGERVIDALSFDLARIKAIKQAVPGATVNDAILAVCGGALRRWLEKEDELPDESLVAMVPVNLRSQDEKSLAGNKVGMIFVPIHSDIRSPLARLRAIHQATERAKTDDTGVSTEEIQEISNLIPALPLSGVGRLITGLGLVHRMNPICNCTITNVPGPREAIYLGPAKMVHTVGCAPIIDGMGLIISIFTYQDKITFSFTSSPEMVPDPESLTRCFAASFNLLHRSAMESGSQQPVSKNA